MSKPPVASNAFTYLVVLAVVVMAMGFLYLMFGELFLVAVLIFAVVGGVGCLHYFVWGRSMTNESNAERAKLKDKSELNEAARSTDLE